jgi:hypothetical protein
MHAALREHHRLRIRVLLTAFEFHREF